MGRKQSDWVWAQDPSLDKDGHALHSKHWTCPLSGSVWDRGKVCRGQRTVAVETSAQLAPTLSL